MSRTVYVDVLFCLNFVVDYLILLSVCKLLRLSSRRWRLILGGAVGAASSFVIFLPPLPSVLSGLINLTSAGLTVACAFVPLRPATFAKATLTFFVVGFCFCGLCIGLWLLFYPQNMLIRNGAVYIDISPVVLLLSTLVCYAVMRIFVRVSGRDICRVKTCTVTVTINGKERSFDATIDTGNTLREPFSDEAVIVVRRALFEDIIPLSCLAGGRTDSFVPIRMVPYNSIGGEGVLPAVMPQCITATLRGRKVNLHAYLAFCGDDKLPNGIEALIPAEIILKEC